MLVIANATVLDVEAPVIPLSFQDVGSGVLAFASSALVLGLLTDREEFAPASWAPLRSRAS